MMTACHAVGAHALQRIHHDVKQYTSINVHKIASNVEAHHIAFALIVVAFLSDVLCHTFDAVMRATSDNATI